MTGYLQEPACPDIWKKVKKRCTWVIAEDSCMKQGNNMGVMVEEGPVGACIAWEGGMVAGMFWRIKVS